MSSLPTFKELNFSSGLNILLAERALEATERQTRNSAGKSSVLEIIHFLLGANADPRSIFRTTTLNEHTFALDFDLPYGKCIASRRGAEANIVDVEPLTIPFPLPTQATRRHPRPHFSMKVWRAVLEKSWFGVDRDSEWRGPIPTFRSMISYFVRRSRQGGLARPERQSTEQQLSDIQINLSFLFNLDWLLPSELSLIRDRERHLKELRSTARLMSQGSLNESVAELRPKVAAAESRLSDLAKRTEQFVVVDQYHEMVREVSQLRARIRKAAAANLVDQERLDQLRATFSTETALSEELVTSMYGELAIALPDAIQRRLEEVKQFHRSVAENRRADLRTEIAELERCIDSRIRESRELDLRRSELMQVLNGAGALEDFFFLQRELANAQQDVAEIRKRFDEAKVLEGEGALLAVQRSDIERRIRADHDSRGDTLEHAAAIIDRLVKRLYDDRSGRLLIEVTENGPRFEIVIDGDRSEGISAVEIWCFDMLTMQLCSERNIGPKFLIHDSHLFDGVDERQASLALEIGAEFAEKCGFQYIVTMNSDQFERLNVVEAVRSAVLPTRLFDNRDDGGLFGIVIADQRTAVAAGDEGQAADEFNGTYAD